MKLKENQLFLSSAKARELMGVTFHTLERWIKAKKINHIRFSDFQDVFFSIDDIYLFCCIKNNKSKSKSNLLHRQNKVSIEQVQNILTVNNLCELLGVSRAFIDKRISENALKNAKLNDNKTNFFNKNEIFVCINSL
ncbi:hypothetical protein [Campylobacter sp. RM12637]|uniref:hypothetical protein n=1 Tax=Campylobacter sp. RM12637 TaxID=2735734 RepID=UPI0030146204|nr:hypothetical protein [Campylobacter sp. RM12637]